MQKFFGQGEGHLSSFSVADRQIGVDQSAGGQSAEDGGFFNDGDSGAILCGGESRGHPRHASACHNHIIVFFKIHCFHSQSLSLRHSLRRRGKTTHCSRQFRRVSSRIFRFFSDISQSGRRYSSRIMPSMAMAAFTGIGFDSMKRCLKSL